MGIAQPCNLARAFCAITQREAGDTLCLLFGSSSPYFLTTGSLLTCQIDSSTFSDRLSKLAPNPSNPHPSSRTSPSDGCVYHCCFPNRFLSAILIHYLITGLFYVFPLLKCKLHDSGDFVLSIPVSLAFRTEHIVDFHMCF